MKTLEDAEALAHAMVRIGNNVGRNTMAIISDMNQPLGRAIGNALELQAIDTLKGQGPKDLTELVLTLGSQMVVLANKAETLEEARALLIEAINSGAALEKFKTFIKTKVATKLLLTIQSVCHKLNIKLNIKLKIRLCD